MRFLEITTSTKTATGNFYEGELRYVDDEVAGLLIGNGWARPHTVELKVDNAKLGVNSEDAG